MFICILVSGVSIRLYVFYSQGCRYVYMYFSVRGVDTFICILVSGCRYVYVYFSVRGVDTFICMLVSGCRFWFCLYNFLSWCLNCTDGIVFLNCTDGIVFFVSHFIIQEVLWEVALTYICCGFLFFVLDSDSLYDRIRLECANMTTQASKT